MSVTTASDKWSRKFLNVVSSVTDSPRPGQAHRLVTPEAIAAGEAILKENHRVTVHEIATHLDMSHGSAHHIVHDVLQFHKVSARWVPRQLIAELKERHVDACQELLKCFEAEGDGFLGRIVTGDKTWVHYHQPEQGMAPYLLTKTEKIPQTTICGKGYADSLLG